MKTGRKEEQFEPEIITNMNTPDSHSNVPSSHDSYKNSTKATNITYQTCDLKLFRFWAWIRGFGSVR